MDVGKRAWLLSTANVCPTQTQCRGVLQLHLCKACIIHMRNWIKTFWPNCWQHRLPLSNHFLGLRFAWFLLVAIFSHGKSNRPSHSHTHTHDTILYGARGATNHIAGIGPRSQAEQTGNLAHNPFKCLHWVARVAQKGKGEENAIWFQQKFRLSASFACVLFR